jgi:glycosyltransferase involved in cell wall biosynthesis
LPVKDFVANIRLVKPPVGRLSLVIPCYNEELAVPTVLRRCLEFKQALLNRGQSLEIMVVDDGSTDLGPMLAASFREVRILRLPRRLGYGAALKAGFLAAEGDWVAMIDMDATYDPMDFLDALPLIERERSLIVMGDRLSRISGMPLTRKIGNHFFVSLIRLLHGKRVMDSCTGFRIFPKSWIRDHLRSLPDDLNFSLAMTLLMLQKDDRYSEIPIRYSTRKGPSKLNIFIHGCEFFWTIVVAALRGRPVLNDLKTLEDNGILPVNDAR